MARTILFAVVVATCLALSPRSFAQENKDFGFEAGEVGVKPSGWGVPTAGWTAELTEEQAAAGTRSAKLYTSGESTEPFGNLMQSVPATEFAGRHVKLTAKVRVVGTGRGQMWLRVDLAGGVMGAFDNMDNRPLLAGDWRKATIEVDVDPDATALNIGFMSFDEATLFIDDVKLSVSLDKATLQEPSPARALSPRALENLVAAAKLLAYVRFFHPSDAAVGVASWDHFAVDLMEQVEPAQDATDLATRLSTAFTTIAPTLDVWSGTVEQAPPLRARPTEATRVARWEHFGAGSITTSTKGGLYRSDVKKKPVASLAGGPAAAVVVKQLGGGVCCRVPVAVYADGGGTLPHGKTPESWASKTIKAKLSGQNRSTRLAGVALGWGVFRHFYPYFDVVETDWDAALPAALSKAAEDADEVAYLFTLREMVAKLHDGHGNVSNNTLRPPAILPLAIRWAGKDLVVIGVHASVSDKVAVGDAIVSIDGRPIADCYAQVSKWISAATDGWRRTMSERAIVFNLTQKDPVTLVVRKPDGRTASVDLAQVKGPTLEAGASNHPENGAELAPGIAYFDLNGTTKELLDVVMPKLVAAQAIIFDLRGYPNSAAYELMQHLIDEPATSARWCVPIFRLPDQEGVEWNESGRWQLEPIAPRLTAKLAFVTDGRAISYAESIMGIVEHYKFGEIIGSTTAGTNGNVNPFVLPGGYAVSWTGMKVLKHDGSVHHGVGIAPTVPVTATAKGIAEGRDEVLEKAVSVMLAKLASEAGSKK